METEAEAWRRYLDTLIRRKSPAEKQRLYQEVGVTRTTIQRWRNGANIPDPSHIHRLLNALPEEEREQMRTLMQEDPALQMPAQDDLLPGHAAMDHIPQLVYEKVLRLSRDASDRFWTLSGAILFHALAQLGSGLEDAGLEILVARCMPPRPDGKIRSLSMAAARGTAPWRTDLHSREAFWGIESAGGYAVMQRHSIIIPDVHDSPLIAPQYTQEHERSTAAVPMVQGEKVAGALVISSTTVDFFNEKKLALLERYADLMRLAFADVDWYPCALVELGLMPDGKTQQAYFRSFRQRINEEYQRSVQQDQSLQALTSVEARVRQALEGELLQLTHLTDISGPV